MKKVLSLLAAFAFGMLLFASPASAQSATITLIHGIHDTDVDVVVGGEVVFEGFSFGQTQDLSSFAGQTLPGVQVVVAGTDPLKSMSAHWPVGLPNTTDVSPASDPPAGSA